MRVPGSSIAALITMIACGGSSGDGAGDPAADETITAGEDVAAAVGVDPCAVLTAEDVREVTGIEPGSPAVLEPVSGGVRLCDWPMAADMTTPILSVMVFPTPMMTYDEVVAQARDLFGDDFDPADYEAVEGLGESAVWSPPTLQTWGNGHMVQIQSGFGGPALDREQSVELARRALARL